MGFSSSKRGFRCTINTIQTNYNACVLILHTYIHTYIYTYIHPFTPPATINNYLPTTLTPKLRHKIDSYPQTNRSSPSNPTQRKQNHKKQLEKCHGEHLPPQLGKIRQIRGGKYRCPVSRSALAGLEERTGQSINQSMLHYVLINNKMTFRSPLYVVRLVELAVIIASK